MWGAKWGSFTVWGYLTLDSLLQTVSHAPGSVDHHVLYLRYAIQVFHPHSLVFSSSLYQGKRGREISPSEILSFFALPSSLHSCFSLNHHQQTAESPCWLVNHLVLNPLTSVPLLWGQCHSTKCTQWWVSLRLLSLYHRETPTLWTCCGPASHWPATSIGPFRLQVLDL